MAAGLRHPFVATIALVASKHYAQEVTNLPAGWYTDPEDGTRSRWWDGLAWTQARSRSYTLTAPAPELRAPEGTDWNTLWVWLILVLPLLSSVRLLFIDWGSFIDWDSMLQLSDPTGMNTFRNFLSPTFLFSTVGGVILYGLGVWFAYLDWRELSRRLVPGPFPWAWAILYSIAYVIGRSVVVRRRTGRGAGPMWAAIATIVLTSVFSIYSVVAMWSTMFASLPDLTNYIAP